MKKVRILSIDGGGIRGILPGIVLKKIEEKLQIKENNPNLRLSDMFDFMAGTSTGGILTLAYLVPDDSQPPRAKLTAERAVSLYLERGDEIFDVSLWQKIKSKGGVSDEKYDAAELEEALDDTFGQLKLSDLLKPCIISSYDIRKGKPHFFKQSRSTQDSYNFKVKDVARATSAAPTYFEAARIKNAQGAPFPLIDGGVFVNNPALAAYSECRTMKFDQRATNPTAKDMMIVSIGTGSESKQYEYKKAKDWGAIGWIKPVIEIMMSGNAQTVHYHLTQIFDTLSEADKQDYYRIEPEIVHADSEMDNGSVENLNRLKKDGENFVARPEEDRRLDEIVNKLIQYK